MSLHASHAISSINVNRAEGEGNMAKRFAYFYSMKNEAKRIRPFIPQHVAYWNRLKLSGYIGGPFADRSGGMITFEARDIDSATDYTNKDPFVLLGLLENRWVREWNVE
jgi:uncharacterized protein YciI